MTLFWITISTLLAGFGLGYVKFFLLSILGAHALHDKNWLIQQVGAIITLGPFLVFWAAAPLSSSLMKRYIMSTAALATFLLLSFGALTDWYGSLWFYLFGSGLLMGFFNPARNAAIPLEAKHGNHTTEGVNAILNIALLLGLLSGIPAATFLHDRSYSTGVMVLLLAFFGCGTAGLLCNFKNETEHLVPYQRSYSSFVHDMQAIIKRYRAHLLIAGLIWGLANAISLAITAYAETTALGDSFECSLMSVYAILGVSLGNVLAIYLTKMRRLAVVIGLFLLMIATASIPLLSKLAIFLFGSEVSYWLLSVLVIILGTGFGMSSNLIEAEYYRGVYEDKMEGTGGALLSAATAVFSSLLGLAMGAALQLHILGPQSQFICLALLVCFPLVFFLQSEDSEGWWHGWAALVVRIALRLRYRMRFINALDMIPTTGPLLIIPNHPAEIDPVIIGSHLWKKRPIIPLITEAFYDLPIVKNVMMSIDAVSLPDMEFNAGPHKKRRVQKAIEEIINKLRSNKAVLMYPSGRLQRGGIELPGANSGVRTILDAIPDIPIVLIRTSGLYGSIFSCAFTGTTTPDFFNSIFQGIKTVLANGIVFVPKRRIQIECVLADETFPRLGTNLEINKWLKDWYNQKGMDQVKLVPYCFWSNAVPKPVDLYNSDIIDVEHVDPEIKSKVFSFLASLAGKNEINTQDMLRDDLGLDSLMLTEVLAWLEEECNVLDVAITDISTVASVLRLASEPNPTPNKSVHELTKWRFTRETSAPVVPSDNNILEAFLHIANQRGREEIFGDNRAGVYTWNRFKSGVYFLRQTLLKIPDERIGVLLPAAISTNVTIMALMAAGKVPVLINWTLGAKVVKEILAESNVNIVLSSRTFLDQVPSDLQEIEDSIVYLESLVSSMGLIDLLNSKIAAHFYSPKLKMPKPDDTAVILFTSGSESRPKGVPLSHKNILTNVKDALAVIPVNADDILYGFLPPFHSFGLTINTFLPLVTGLRAAYYPNPTESRKLARGLSTWGGTIVAGTPTFLKNILNTATHSELATLRLMLAGAEKVSTKLFDLAQRKTPHALLLEGYGITECSPIVSVNRPNTPACGVGQPLPSVVVKVLHPESLDPLPEGEEGLLVVSAPSVFSGYLTPKPNTFITLDYQQWYNTGDLGYIQNNCIIISGRLKRFVKIAGEMISLQAIEDTILQLTPFNSPDTSTENLNDFQVALIAYEPPNGDRPLIGLFTNRNLDLAIVNLFLREQGFATIVKLHSITVLSELPMLGTGKYDLKQLENIFHQNLVGQEL
jgi:long-chain-fatty-acid--[acyl-carrier-protein] ligase